MWKFLSSLFGGPRQRTPGYVYVADEEPGLMAGARAGSVIRIPGKGPPWIVVDDSIESVVVARWPGKLWRVEIVKPAPARDQLASGGVPRPDAGYTRAARVRVLDEVAPAVLFGSHGASVVRAVEAARMLELVQARALVESRHPDAPRACARVWRAWLGPRKPLVADGDDFDGTLSLGGTPPVSPVNHGLSVLHGAVFRRAVTVSGDAATTIDGEDVWLCEPWRGASSALIDAALAFGAPDHVTPPDREVLMQAWVRVFGA